MIKYIGMDVGGTKIKASIISSDGEIVDKIEIYDSKSKAGKEDILNNFNYIMNDLILKNISPDLKLAGIGLAFPGPFDYKNGISYIKNLNKYESIYGIQLKKELKAVIENEPGLKKYFQEDFEISIANDGDLFSLGECLESYAVDSVRTICICIGTGVGSAFLERGHLIKNAKDVPKEVFKEFGKWLKEVMGSFFDEFKPDTFIIGGQIAKAFQFFNEEISKECRDRNIHLYITRDTSRSTLRGVAMLFKGGNYYAK